MSTTYSELVIAALDTEVLSATTASLDVKGNGFVSLHIKAATGAHATHVVTLQCGPDDSTWTDTASTITGEGMVDNVQITTRFVRLKVTTADGETSTVSGFIQGK